ncbi:MAG: hypothetical protein HC781_09465 [Leptolyngbyaceae cyanobacterium CSU_1_4]|nr:hypothetical protein [Leptolyngbyaceae cyanobacterium CSU_1_4]
MTPQPSSYPLSSWDSYSNVPVDPPPIAPPKRPSLEHPTSPALDPLPPLPEPIAPDSPPAKILELVPQRLESLEADKAIKPKKDHDDGSLLGEETQDRSDEIARIGVEMKRLGWTTIQGREYLKQRYGKRSRQELNDSELLDFLAYLENQPAPS